MDFPLELQLYILSFSIQPTFQAVCKDWNNEVKRIYKKSVDVIGKWYRTRRLSIGIPPNSINLMIRGYILFCQPDVFISLPERLITSSGLNPILLTVIPPTSTRKRTDVAEWVRNAPLTVLDWWIFVGHAFAWQKYFYIDWN
jgi:hypothetical protein